MTLSPAAIGLCAGCRFTRRIESARGSTFFLCRRAESDPRYSKYPQLPVRVCPGFAPGPPGEDS